MKTKIRSPLNYYDDFVGGAIPGAATPGYPWFLRDTSPAGNPTIAFVSNGTAVGELSMLMSATSEATVLGIDFNDVLSFPIDRLQSVEFLLRIPTAFNAASGLAFGMKSAFNASNDATTLNAQFQFVGNMLARLDTDDNVIDLGISSGMTVVANVPWRFVIDFQRGKNNIQFFAGRMDGSMNFLNGSQVFSMANTVAQLQPFIQLTKSSGVQTDGVIVDYVGIDYKRV